ncbi:unnamed protein product [marine sediment metagenome]|uniref:Uncharacterized protein n=1 Tax=marine sediment metagenome TaxID=412755 RepID=X0U611_9ZZZZ
MVNRGMLESCSYKRSLAKTVSGKWWVVGGKTVDSRESQIEKAVK